MSTLEFYASVIGSSAWPITLTVFLLVLRRPIFNAFRGRAISKISLGGNSLEFDWQEKAKEVASLVSATGGDNEQVQQLAPKNVTEVVAAWKELEDLIRARLNAKGISSGMLTDGESLVDVASKRGVLTVDQANSLRGLLSMRNLAVRSHEGELTDARVTDFLVLASAMKTVLHMTERDIGKEVGQHTAALISGQSELATMSYDRLKKKLQDDFPVLKS